MADQTNRIILQGVDNTGPAVQSAKQNIASLGNQAQMSAKQTAAAMRMVPAQVTDIVVGLASGQRPLTVLLQQGGQLKDMFGGVVPAAKALGAVLTSLINPVTVLAAGIGAVTVAYMQGAKESEELNKVLILTGNYAGLTASSLNEMAKSMSKSFGMTRSDAADALVQVISTGKVTTDQLSTVASAAVQMSKVTGDSVKQTVAQFVQLGEEPAAASAKLNEQYHYLTDSVYQQIRALEEQGAKEQAASLAQRTLASAVADRAKQVQENLGYLETAWNGVGKAAKWAWDKMMNLGRDQTGAEQLEGLRKQLAERQQRGPLNDLTRDAWEKGNKALEAQIALLERINAQKDKSAKADGERQRAQDAAIAAQPEVERWQNQAKGIAAVNRELKNYHDRLDIIRKANPNDPRLDPAKVKAGEDAIRKSFIGDDVEHGLDARIKALQGAVQGVERSTKQSLDQVAADYDVGLLSTKEYINKQFEIRQAGLQKELGLVRQQEAIARGKKNIAAAEQYKNDEKRILDEIAANQAKHAEDVAKNTAKAQRAVAEYVRGLNAEYNTRQEAIDDQLSGAGLSARQREQQQRLLDVQREYNKRREDLARERSKGEAHGGISQEEYDKELSALDTYYRRRLAQEGDYNTKSDALRSDWLTGAKQAYAEYADSAKDTAGMSARLFTDAMQGMEDVLVQFATTGKLNFKQLANSIIGDIARIQAKAMVSQLFGSGGGGNFMQMLGSAAFGNWGGAQAAFSQTSIGASGFGSGLAYGNMDLGAFLHSGGIAGSERTFTRRVDPRVFLGAYKYHTGGLAGYEVPAILRRGEGVFTPGQMKALGGGGQGGVGGDLKLTMINQTPVPWQTVERSASPNDRVLIVQEALDAFAASMHDANSRPARALAKNYDVRRKR